MKKLSMLLAGFIIAGTVAACSGDDDNTSVNGNATAVINNMKSGTWKITKYVEDGDDELHHFNGFNFDFNENGTVTAVNGDTTYTGTWSVTDSDNSTDDDNSGSDIDFNIAFTAPDEFADLSDDWDIMARTGIKVELIDVSGGNGGTDYLTFEKN